MTMFRRGGLLLLYVALSLGTAAPSGAEPQNKSEDQNLATIKSAFDAWRAGTRSPFDKLTPDTTWTIVGNSVVAGTYHGKADVEDNVLTPFNARLSHGLVPTVNNIYSDGDTVIALFDADATARDGLPYHNSYACSCVYARAKSSTSQHSSTASPSTTCGSDETCNSTVPYLWSSFSWSRRLASRSLTSIVRSRIGIVPSPSDDAN